MNRERSGKGSHKFGINLTRGMRVKYSVRFVAHAGLANLYALFITQIINP
jgi:hypothetical protein